MNPDNPSGNFIPKTDLLVLISWAKNKKIRLIVDESFVDFAKEGLGATLFDNSILAQNQHLIVIKSISKSYGVPGLRLGTLACSDEELIADIKKDIAIWNINSFAEFYMQIFGKYENDYSIACNKFIIERDRFFQQLQSIDYLRVIPSQANFFLCEVMGKLSSTELTKILLDKNVLIKDCSTKSAFRNKNYIRIAIRDKKDNDKLIQILKDEIY